MKKFYLYYSGISVLICISASLVFSCVYGNIQGSMWAGAASLISAHYFVLCCLYHSNKLQLYYGPKSLNHVQIWSFILVLLSSTFLLWYIFAMVYWKIPLYEYDKTPVFPCVFTFITGKWGLHMYGATKEYLEFLESNYSPIVQAI